MFQTSFPRLGIPNAHQSRVDAGAFQKEQRGGGCLRPLSPRTSRPAQPPGPPRQRCRRGRQHQGFPTSHPNVPPKGPGSAAPGSIVTRFPKAPAGAGCKPFGIGSTSLCWDRAREGCCGHRMDAGGTGAGGVPGIQEGCRRCGRDAGGAGRMPEVREGAAEHKAAAAHLEALCTSGPQRCRSAGGFQS